MSTAAYFVKKVPMLCRDGGRLSACADHGRRREFLPLKDRGVEQAIGAFADWARARVAYAWWVGLLCSILTVPSAVHAATVELTNGSRMSCKRISYRDEQLVCDDGRTIPRGDVARVLFERGAATTSYDGVVGRSDVAELMRQADEAVKDYPDVGAITLIDDGEQIFREDGTRFDRSHFVVKVLKDDWKAMAEIGRGFEEGRERITLVRARAIAPDGTVTELSHKDLKEANPMSGMDSFDDYKMLSGQLPNVKVGSIVEILWDAETYNPYDKELFFPTWTFVATEPCLWSRCIIRIPKSRTLYYRTPNMPEAAAEPTVTETENERVYTWEMRDIPPIVGEPRMPPLQQVAPRVLASTHESWDYLYDYLGRFQKEHIKLTPAINDRVTQIVEGADTAEEKLARLYHWLQREIRYVSIKGGIGSGWSGHPAALTLENGYGDCIDKAILFSTMLEAIDVRSVPVLLTTNDAPADDRTLPRLYANHAINKVYLEDRSFYLDTTAETYRYPYFRADDHGVTTINVLEREIGRIDVPPPEHNALDIRLDMTVDVKGNVDADAALGMTGSIEAGLRTGLEQINKMLLKMAAQQAVNAISPGAQLQELNISDEEDLTVPLTVKMKIRLPEYPSFAGDLMIFPLPLSDKIYQFVETSLDEREFDIDYHSSSRMDRHIRLHVPDGFEVKGLPVPLNLETSYIRYQSDFSRDGDAIVFEDSFVQPRRIVPKEDYAAHKAMLERVANYSKKPVFLRRVGDDRS